MSQILDAYEGTLDGYTPQSEEYEHSEMLLYKVQLLLEGGSLLAALTMLNSCQVSHGVCLSLKIDCRSQTSNPGC